MNACSEAPQASSSTSSGGEIKQVAAAALPRIDATMSTREAFMMSNRQDGASADANREDSSAGGGGDGHRATSTASVEMTTNVSSAAPSAPSPAEPSHEELQQMQTHLLPAQQPMQQKQKQKQPHEPPSHPQQTSTGAAGSLAATVMTGADPTAETQRGAAPQQGLLPQYPTGLQERIMAFYQLRMAQAAHQAGEASQQRGAQGELQAEQSSSQPMESASGAAGRHGGSLPVVTGEAGPTGDRGDPEAAEGAQQGSSSSADGHSQGVVGGHSCCGASSRASTAGASGDEVDAVQQQLLAQRRMLQMQQQAHQQTHQQAQQGQVQQSQLQRVRNHPPLPSCLGRMAQFSVLRRPPESQLITRPRRLLDCTTPVAFLPYSSRRIHHLPPLPPFPCSSSISPLSVNRPDRPLSCSCPDHLLVTVTAAGSTSTAAAAAGCRLRVRSVAASSTVAPKRGGQR